MTNNKKITSEHESLVSVIIPTHNRSKMLARALNSVFNQTYYNFEIIIIGDCCTDNTSQVVNSFKDNRIIFIPLQENVGGAQARNIGLKRANGEFISFLDDDDEWLTNKTKEQINIFKNKPNLAIIASNYYINDGKSESINKIKKKKINLKDLLFENYCGSFSFCMTKKKFIKNLEINPKLKASQDWDFWIKILSTTGLCAEFLSTPMVRYYSGHENKLTKNLKNTLDSYLIFLRCYWSIMNLEQKKYNSYKFIKMKRKYLSNHIGYFYNLKLFIKALIEYRNSRYDQNFYNYLLIIPQVINFNFKKKSF
jgi:glycosyltransferase involved in cell wall biosynthesis